MSASSKGLIAERLTEARQRTLDLVEPLDDAELNRVYSPLLRWVIKTVPPIQWLRRRYLFNYCELLTRTDVPAWVVVGEDDAYTPVSDAEFMHRQLPDSTLTVIAGAGHMPNLEYPVEFNAALTAYLKGLTEAAIPR